MYTTFLASAFRSIRFGVSEAHGRGIALQLNALLDAGAFQVNPDGTFSVVKAKIKEAVTALSRELLMLEARGDYAGAAEMARARISVRPPVQKILDRLQSVPVDIEPKYVTADALAGRAPAASRTPSAR